MFLFLSNLCGVLLVISMSCVEIVDLLSVVCILVCGCSVVFPILCVSVCVC